MQLMCISRIMFDPWDNRKLFGLITCGRCGARVSGHSAGFHASVILDGAACRLGELGDVRDVLGVLRILVSW